MMQIVREASPARVSSNSHAPEDAPPVIERIEAAFALYADASRNEQGGPES
jgi:hypothetical protein